MSAIVPGTGGACDIGARRVQPVRATGAAHGPRDCKVEGRSTVAA